MKNYNLECLSLVALIGGMALWGYLDKTPSAVPKGATRANAATAKATPNKGFLKADKMEGEELARLLRLSVYKWKVRYPAGAKNVVFWVEDWRKGHPQPEIVTLLSSTVAAEDSKPDVEPADLLIKLPEEGDAKFTASLGGATSSLSIPKLATDASLGTTGTTGSPSMPIFMDQSIVLTATTQNRSGIYSGSYDDSQTTKNDRTILYKMQFGKSPAMAVPLWENGRVVVKAL